MTSEQEQIAMLTKKVQEQAEIIDYLTRKLFGKKSEQIDPNQLSLLDEDDGVFKQPEQTGEENRSSNQVQITKKKQKTRQAILSPNLPVKKITIDVETKQCPSGHRLVPVGSKFVRQELHFQPAKLYLEEIYTNTYKCPACELIDGISHLIQATAPQALMPHSLGSASLITEIIHQKFEQDVPLYRQLKDWRRLGVDLSETTISNWVVKTSQIVEPLYQLMRQELMGRPYLQGDETPMEVLREPGKIATAKSYTWLARTTTHCINPLVIYTYSDTRAGSFARELYQGFSGVLQCDGYSGYNGLKGVTRLGCFVHVHRKFYDAALVNGQV